MTTATAADLQMRVLMYLRCEGLKNLDVMSKSDPQAIVSINGQTAGKTEIVQNNLNPVWKTPIPFVYQFETLQRLRVDVVDADDKKGKTGELEGTWEGDVGSIVASKGSTVTSAFTSGGKGKITLTIEEVKQERGAPPPGKTVVEASAVSGLAVAELHGTRTITTTTDSTIVTCSATGLDKKDFFGKSDPYLIVKREIGGAMVEVLRTETLKKTLNPQWKPVIVRTETLGSATKPILIEVWDWDAVGKDDIIGTATCADIFACPPDGATNAEVQITAEKKGGKKPSGTVRFAIQRKVITETKTETYDYKIVANTPLARDQKSYPGLFSRVSFLDAMKRGLQIQTACCLDLTGSNGSMHDIGPAENPNPYEVAMKAVGSVLQPYDSDGRFLFYGYGASVSGEGFPPFFTIDTKEHDIAGGVDGMIDTYRKNRQRFSLGDMGSASGGDMNWRAHKHRYFCDDFYQVINHVSDLAEKEMTATAPPGSGRQPPHYFIQFFVIDGDGFDEEGTRRAIVRASALPVSIVLVGVGSSSFPNLSSYDSDDKPLKTSDGVSAVRDIVQFVKFDSFKSGKDIDTVRLAAEVLAEVPHQVESFLALYGIAI